MKNKKAALARRPFATAWCEALYFIPNLLVGDQQIDQRVEAWIALNRISAS